ncbi:MAG: hypothetical protein U0X93_08260 [Anaerolineales bacterium]
MRGNSTSVDVLILGGDMTGKAVVPFIHQGGEKLQSHIAGAGISHHKRRRTRRHEEACAVAVIIRI